jgi:hypothetical protein
MMQKNNQTNSINHITGALDAMSYWQKRNGIEKSTPK